MLARKALAGTAGAPKEYVEDVFSCFLYTGNNNTAQTITNNIDLSTEGGLIWFKDRSNVNGHFLIDTVRGANSQLRTHSTAAETTSTNYISSFNNNGFTLGTNGNINGSETQVSWTFRKAKKFFDVVTFTAASSGNTTVSHNLGSTPGFVIVKRTDNTSNWITYHRSYTSTNYYQYLNSTAAQTDFGSAWITTSSTNCVFDSTVLNASASYVMYVFAHDAGGFGDAGSDSIIKCGSYTGNGSSTGPTVTLDWEPQWIMIKKTNEATDSDWMMFDTMRGIATGGNDLYLKANSSGAETNAYDFLSVTATGFQLTSTYDVTNGNGDTYIYIAIRRGPMKTPTSGTSVYAGVTANAASTPVLVTFNTVIESGDLGFATNLNNANRAYGGTAVFDRLRGANYLFTNSTNSEGAASGEGFIDQKSYVRAFGSGDVVGHFFRRAPGFFDVVCYTGTGSARTVSHNLGVVPELMIVKSRTTTDPWPVYHVATGNNGVSFLNSTSATGSDNEWNYTTPTSSVFSVGAGDKVNGSGQTYVAYLFASVSGVSKVGSYTGNGSSVTVTTDFQPRFIMVKRTDSTGNWIVSDSARGLVAGNDPYLLLNSTAAEDTDEDWVDVSSTGFTVNETSAANANVNTGTYIYLAIA